MLRRVTAAAALALLLAPAGAFAQETYEIKYRERAQGETALLERSEDVTQKVKVLDANKNVLDTKDEKKKENFLYRETIVEKKKGDDRATRVKRQYRKASVTEGGETKTLGLEGKTVLIEKKGDRYEFEIEGGGELSEADRKELNEEFNKKDSVTKQELEKLFLPGKAVKVGEEWTIDITKLTKLMETEGKMAIDAVKSKGTGRLTRAYKKDGKQFGVIEVTIDLIPTAILEAGKRIELQPGARARLTVTSDGCIDGSSTVEQGRMAMAMDVTALIPLPDGTNASVIVSMEAASTSRTTEEK